MRLQPMALSDDVDLQQAYKEIQKMATPPKEMVEKLIREACFLLTDPDSTKRQRALSRWYLNQQRTGKPQIQLGSEVVEILRR